MKYRPHFRRAPAHPQHSLTMKLSVPASELLLRGTVNNPNGNTARTIAQYYNFPPAPANPPTIAILSLGGSYKTSDLQSYWNLQGIPGTPNVNYVNVAGTTNKPDQPIVPGDGSEENTLDLEIATSICPTAQFIVYFAPNSYNGFYQGMTAAINGPARIITVSWGGPENTFNGKTGIAALEILFRQAQNAGKLIVGAVGDSGSGDGTAKLITDYPACSPSVLACGGTSLLANGQEVGWSWNAQRQWGTGGGVSNYCPVPSYQRGVVGPFSGRAVPDLSLVADPATGWSIYYNGNLEVNSWGGTSCVAPAIAALFACYNLPSYASIHQQLYSISHTVAFRDILVGNNDSVDNSGKSYAAKPGYDLVTGWGSIHGMSLNKALLRKPVKTR